MDPQQSHPERQHVSEHSSIQYFQQQQQQQQQHAPQQKMHPHRQNVSLVETQAPSSHESNLRRADRRQPIIIQNFELLPPGQMHLKRRSLSTANLFLSSASLKRGVEGLNTAQIMEAAQRYSSPGRAGQSVVKDMSPGHPSGNSTSPAPLSDPHASNFRKPSLSWATANNECRSSRHATDNGALTYGQMSNSERDTNPNQYDTVEVNTNNNLIGQNGPRDHLLTPAKNPERGYELSRAHSLPILSNSQGSPKKVKAKKQVTFADTVPVPWPYSLIEDGKMWSTGNASAVTPKTAFPGASYSYMDSNNNVDITSTYNGHYDTNIFRAPVSRAEQAPKIYQGILKNSKGNVNDCSDRENRSSIQSNDLVYVKTVGGVSVYDAVPSSQLASCSTPDQSQSKSVARMNGDYSPSSEHTELYTENCVTGRDENNGNFVEKAKDLNSHSHQAGPSNVFTGESVIDRNLAVKKDLYDFHDVQNGLQTLEEKTDHNAPNGIGKEQAFWYSHTEHSNPYSAEEHKYNQNSHEMYTEQKSPDIETENERSPNPADPRYSTEVGQVGNTLSDNRNLEMTNYTVPQLVDSVDLSDYMSSISRPGGIATKPPVPPPRSKSSIERLCSKYDSGFATPNANGAAVDNPKVRSNSETTVTSTGNGAVVMHLKFLKDEGETYVKKNDKISGMAAGSVRTKGKIEDFDAMSMKVAGKSLQLNRQPSIVGVVDQNEPGKSQDPVTAPERPVKPFKGKPGETFLAASASTPKTQGEMNTDYLMQMYSATGERRNDMASAHDSSCSVSNDPPLSGVPFNNDMSGLKTDSVSRPTSSLTQRSRIAATITTTAPPANVYTSGDHSDLDTTVGGIDTIRSIGSARKSRESQRDMQNRKLAVTRGDAFAFTPRSRERQRHLLTATLVGDASADLTEGATLTPRAVIQARARSSSALGHVASNRARLMSAHERTLGAMERAFFPERTRNVSSAVGGARGGASYQREGVANGAGRTQMNRRLEMLVLSSTRPSTAIERSRSNLR